MLRVFYRWVLRAHPRYFRQRFGDEMQSIFDRAASPGTEVGLLVDAVLSLLRQWSLRPQFWEQPTLAEAADGVPLFHTLESSKPRAAALVYGALLSALVLNGISWTMGYAWNHPVYLAIKQPVISPPAFWGVRGTPSQKVSLAAEPPLYTDQGRVVLIFNSPVYTASHALGQTKPSKPEPESPDASSGSRSTKPATAPLGKQGMVF
jgi:hypothetical protein